MSADEHVASLLEQATSANTEHVRAAEAELKKLFKSPACIEQLIRQIQQSPKPAHRQLASILLAQKINKLWSKLAANDQAVIKGLLLTILTQEPEKSVRRAVIGIVSKLAQHQLPNHWQELLKFISDCTTSPNDQARELAFTLLAEITTSLGKQFHGHFKELKGLYMTGLTDQKSANVRLEATKAACAIIDYLQTEKEVLAFRDLVPVMLEVVKANVATGDEDLTIQFFDIFGDVAISNVPLLTPYLEPFLQFLLQTIANENLANSVRASASLVITQVVTFKPKTLAKRINIGETLNLCLSYLARAKSPGGAHIQEDDLDAEEEEISPARIAEAMLDKLAIHVPKKYFFAPAYTIFLGAINSGDALAARAGCHAFGIIAEGSADDLRPKIDEFINPVYQLCTSQDPVSREVAGFTLGQLAIHLTPDIIDHHEKFLPALFSLLNDPSPRVLSTSCAALESYCEGLDKEHILPYMEPLVGRLVHLIKTSSPDTQETAMTALSSVAVTVEEDFLPYVEQCVALMKMLLVVTDEKLMDLRAKALEFMGHLAIALGKDAFRPYLEEMMNNAAHSLALNNMNISEHAYVFFCNAVKVYGKELAGYLPDLVAHLIKMLDETAQAESEDAQRILAQYGRQNGLEVTEDEEDDDDDDSEFAPGQVRSGLVDMKTSALDCIAYFAKYTGSEFAKFAEMVEGVLAQEMNHPHHEIRSSALLAISNVVVSVFKLHHGDAKPEAGTTVELHPVVFKILEQFVQEFLIFYEEGADVSDVVEICGAFELFVDEMGIAGLAGKGPAIMTLVAQLLKGEAPCQKTVDENDDDDDDENKLLDATADLIVALSGAFGPSFETYFKVFGPELVKCLGENKPVSDRLIAMGCLGDVLKALGPQIVPNYANDLLPAILAGLAMKDSSMQHDSCYVVGVLAENGGKVVEAHYLNILRHLHPLFQASKKSSYAGVLDNAVSAISKMIMQNPAAMPLGQVLPILLTALPIKVDEQEREPVYRCLCGLVNQRQADTMNFVPQIVSVFAQVLGDEDVDEAIKSNIVQTFHGLGKDFDDQMRSVIESLPAEQRNTLLRFA